MKKVRSSIRGTSSSSNVVDVFEKDGRAVPVYNDKHLSWSFEKAKWMVDASKRLKFPVAGWLFAPGDLAACRIWNCRLAARSRTR